MPPSTHQQSQTRSLDLGLQLRGQPCGAEGTVLPGGVEERAGMRRKPGRGRGMRAPGYENSQLSKLKKKKRSYFPTHLAFLASQFRRNLVIV